ncbi:MOSC domain-containing protein [Pelagibius litoralis]|nr:MOSC domain-containing protein [Pelagibius litoralis]
MSARTIGLIANQEERWQLSGDNLFVDLDLSDSNVPSGQRLGVGTAVLEVSAVPHGPCGKFVERYGKAAAQFVNSRTGKQLHLRGVYAKIVKAGTIRVGDVVTKLA